MLQIAALFFGLITTITIDGFIRTFFAKWFGDNTAYNHGFLSINPAIHVNFFTILPMIFATFVFTIFTNNLSSVFTTIMLIMIFSGLKWNYFVPYNPNNFLQKEKTAAKYELVVWVTNNLFAFFLLAMLKILEQSTIFSTSILIGINTLIFSTVHIIVVLSCFDIYPLPFFRGFAIYEYYLPRFATFIKEINSQILFAILLATFFFGGFLIIPSIVLALFKFLLFSLI